ncbi:hypothetical protein [Prosthecomicrobium sp. N25]
MQDASTLKAIAVAAPVTLALLAASLWLWAKFGLGVYFDAAVSAIANCL